MNGALRIKCPKCGKIVDISAPTTCSCGEQLGAFQGAVQVYRMGNPLGMAVGFGVYINGQPWGHLGNTETVTYTLPFGTYTFHMTHGVSRKCKDITVTLSPETPVAYLKARIKPGVFTNTVIIEPSDPSAMPH